MGRSLKRRRVGVVLVTTAAALLAISFALVSSGRVHSAKSVGVKLAAKELEPSAQGGKARTAESSELFAAMAQFDNARNAPSENGAAPGAYSAAYGNLQSLATTGGPWQELTNVPYDADDPDYRDYYSNSSGGSGNVTGRITGLAADGNGNVYAAGANGGVWRSTTGGGNWTPIADALPSLSSGDLELHDGALWYATGEANTGGTSYAGTGVYRLANPASGTFAQSDRVGGTELESTTINSIRFTKTDVWVATLRGIFSHSLSGSLSAPWQARFQPNPSYLPGGANAGVQQAGYKNVVNDLVIDPKNEKHMVAAVGWRSGDAYNGFYESTDGGNSWNRVNPQGGIDATDIGYANFAYSSDGKKLYVINQSPRKINSLGAIPMTYLDGVYESDNGLLGPWNLIASSDKLGATATGSALYANYGLGYSPGIQAWYNQFITVDPKNSSHVIIGLEEVYETHDAGGSWDTIGPYWDFYFSCWSPDSLYPPDGIVNHCPQTTHSDQHSVAIGKVGSVDTLFVGNDGGVYKRPLEGTENANHNATDWTSLNDGTIDALQYYYVGVGKLNDDDATRPDLTSGDKVAVSGGLQDNGGSLLRPGSGKMVSNFGGDGGDVLVDPNDGCNIVQEYVYLAMSVTQTCANPGADHPNAFLDLSQSTTFRIGPPDINAQFIAPFTANDKNIDQWVAAGNSLWYQDKGFAIRKGSEWRKIFTLPRSNQTFTAVSYSGNTLVASWCGPCSASGAAAFARGVVVGKFDPSKPAAQQWKVEAVSLPADFPNRYVQGVAVNPNDETDLYFGINGFSRRYTDGPGAGLGHVWESKNGTFTDITSNMPDIPVSDIVVLKGGALAVATDLGVIYRAAGSTTWTRLGSGLPTTTVMDLHVGPDGNLYAATHGRGLWRVPLPTS